MKTKSTYYKAGMDIFIVLFIAVFVVLASVIPFIQEKESHQNIDPATQGNLIVTLEWPANVQSDVDLWIWNDIDKTSVGYSNLSGPLFNLIRDDLGSFLDLTNANTEMALSRGIPDGEYVINTHLFSLKSAPLPLPIKISVSKKDNLAFAAVPLFTVTGELMFEGHEKTMAVFRIENGEYVADSFNTISRKIRSGGPDRW